MIATLKTIYLLKISTVNLCKAATPKKAENCFSRPSFAYCKSKVLQEHSAILSTFIKLPFCH